MSFLKTNFLVKHVPYFSDGAASQYKNCASMLLTIKSLLLGFFFLLPAMAKERDGIDGTIKCLVARASLQATKEGQILTPMQLYSWANEHVTGIKVVFVSKQD